MSQTCHVREFWAVLLLTGLAVGLFGRSISADEQVCLRAGAAKTDITLPLGAINGGVIMRGERATRIHDELHVRCLALDDGNTKLAIAVCDLRMIGREVVDRAKQLIADSISVSPDNLLICATHTHAAPAVIGIHEREIDRWYVELVALRIAEAVRSAFANLAPAKIGWGFSSEPEHVFNRRWFMREGSIPPNPFGETNDQVRMNPPRGSDDLTKPAGPVDPQLSVVSVRHADGRPLAVLANYSLHYVGGYERGQVSADYFAVFSDRVQQLMDADRSEPPFVAMMTNGTSGDVNNIDFEKPRQRNEPWMKMRQVANQLAEAAVQAEKKIEHRDVDLLDVATTELQLHVRRPNERRLAWARETLAKAKNPDRLTRPEVYASEAQYLDKFPETIPVKLQTLRIGKLSIAAIPCEVFAETGLAIKAKSPSLATFTIELANGYLPTAKQHELGGYETWPARSSYLEKAAETKIRTEILELLERIDKK